jgi:plastocyanin
MVRDSEEQAAKRKRGMRNRSQGATFATSRLRLALGLVATGAATILLSACSTGSEPMGDVSQGAAREDAVEIVIDDMAFGPDVLELEPGQEVTVEVSNEDSMPHDFVLQSLDVSTGTIEPGGVATATFTVPPSDTTFVCTIHPDMTGRIETTPAM